MANEKDSSAVIFRLSDSLQHGAGFDWQSPGTPKCRNCCATAKPGRQP